jgi:hypothetical protein
VSAAARRFDRRGLFARVAVVGSAVMVSGTDYILRPGSAYASVCGAESACVEGWSAMCCTINSGVNTCPPGSFPGGWWKAADASLCGGHARYYVDCQAECRCGCAAGTHFCDERCWWCKPHCADNGTCDQRRVCHNVFRYGQCNRDRHCSGPVVCRVISCTPPWMWTDCSRSTATDDFTVTHSAPCLPRWTAIQRRYTALGSQASVLGATVHGEIAARRARIQRYQHGRMYWAPNIGAHYLTAEILATYLRAGQTGSTLGLPTTDVVTDATHVATYAHFQRGSIFKVGAAHADVLTGDIAMKYRQLGYQASRLGYPTTSIRATAGKTGHYARFANGLIYQGPHLAAYEVDGDIAAKYESLSAEVSPLGYPTSDRATLATDTGAVAYRNTFQTGAIVEVPPGAAYAVWGPIYTAWIDHGGLRGELGYPTTDVITIDSTHTQSTFEHGTATYDATTGVVTIVVNP